MNTQGGGQSSGSPTWERITAFIFGIVFLVLLLVIAIFIGNPTPFQIFVFRIALALAAAGLGAVIPGFIVVNAGKFIRAGGAIALFAICYWFNPPQILSSQPSSANSSAPVGPSVSNPQHAPDLTGTGSAPTTDEQPAPGDCVLSRYQQIIPFQISPTDLRLKDYQAVFPFAAEGGDLACVKLCVTKGVNVNEGGTTENPETALMAAADKGRVSVAEYLLTSGADVNQSSPNKVTAVLYAIDSSDPMQMVGVLVDHGADVNQRATEGWTPLMAAARVGEVDVIEYLLKHGADPCLRTDDGRTASAVAKDNKHNQAAQVLQINCSK